MCNRCQNPDSNGYWAKKWLEIPYSCINCSLHKVCANCAEIQMTSNEYQNNTSTDLCPLTDDNGDYLWFGRCKNDRVYKNPFVKHLKAKNPCRHAGILGGMTRNSNCTPGFLKFFLLSPECSIKTCGYEPEIDDPFERARLGNVGQINNMTPFIRPNLDSTVGHWYESAYDEYGNLLNDWFSKYLQTALMKRPPKAKDYKIYGNLDKAWLQHFCEFYKNVAANTDLEREWRKSQALKASGMQDIIKELVKLPVIALPHTEDQSIDQSYQNPVGLGRAVPANLPPREYVAKYKSFFEEYFPNMKEGQ